MIAPPVLESPTSSQSEDKSKRNVKSQCKKSERKRKRNLGEAYENARGELVPEKRVGPTCGCPQKCREKLKNKEQEIFNAFWSIGKYEDQNAYLSDLLQIMTPKRRRNSKKRASNVESRRGVSVQYFLKVDDADVQVCKKEFLAVHGLRTKRVEVVREKMCAGGGLDLLADHRGKHGNRANKLPIETVNFIEDHIRAITNFGDSNFDGSKLSYSTVYYKDYKELCAERNVKAVGERKYRELFFNFKESTQLNFLAQS